MFNGRWVATGFFCLILALSGCSSANLRTANTNPSSTTAIETATTKVQQTTSRQEPAESREDEQTDSDTDKSEPAPSPASGVGLCDAVDQSISTDLAGEPWGQEERIDTVVGALPTELRSEYETLQRELDESPDADMSAKIVRVFELVDEYTTEQCGVPYMQATLHLLLACVPDADEFKDLYDVGECTDPRVDQDGTRSLNDSVDIILDLGRHAEEKFEEIGEELE